jgi:hypothetical protein
VTADSVSVGSVTGLLASFRELRGIGPATESRLHEAGIYTWEALADVLAALANVRGGLEGLRAELAELSTSHADGRPVSGSERAEAFVLRLAVAAGAVNRCSVTHVRSQEEQAWPQWVPDDLLCFIREHAELAEPPQSRPSTQGMPAGDARSRHHLVVLDAGKVLGGGHRPVELLVPTAALMEVEGVDWAATLGGRRMGVDGATSWEAPDRLVGRIAPPEPILLRFGLVPLPRGLQRLWLRLELRLSTPVTGVPDLAVQKAAAEVP